MTYSYKVNNPGMVALDYVYLDDDHCSPIKYVSGDISGDLKLDTTETWTYTCQTNLIETTTNIVSARGESNGLIARDLAVVTVVVPTGPSFPNTGPSSNIVQQVRAITSNLTLGSRGSSTRTLQQFLIYENKGPAARVLGSHGTTLYFGPLTKAALVEWQQSVGIAPATGRFGPATRDYISRN